MAPIKRKGTAGDDSSTKKRARVGADEKKTDQSKQNGTSAAQKDSELSVFRDEEPSFPRGGGSVLTPLERKQIQIQATRDVLFEQKGSGKAGDGLEDEDAHSDVEMQDTDKGTSKTKKSRKTRSQKREDQGTSAKQGVRIEGLSFKVRTPGIEAYFLC